MTSAPRDNEGSPPGSGAQRRASDSGIVGRSSDDNGKPDNNTPESGQLAVHNDAENDMPPAKPTTPATPSGGRANDPSSFHQLPTKIATVVMSQHDERLGQQHHAAAQAAAAQSMQPGPHPPPHGAHGGHALHASYGPTDASHYMPPHGIPPEQMRYNEQQYGAMRPVYAPPHMYYDPSMAAAADYSVDPTHPVYPTISTRTSPVNAYTPQAGVPPFHPTTPPVPQAAWTGSPIGQPQYYGSFSGIAGPPQHGGQPQLTDELGHRHSIPSVYLTHAPGSTWSSPVISSPFQFFSPFPAASPQMDRVESMGSPVPEPWSGSAPTQRQVRPGFVPPPQQPHAGGVAWTNAPNVTPNPSTASTARDPQRRSWSGPSGEEAKSSPAAGSQRPIPDRERKEYHPQPPARRSEWVMWVGNVPSNVSHEELWRFFNSTVPTGAGENGETWHGPSSIFLISRSSCAFVNFSSQADLDKAVPYFNGLSLRPWDARCPRMVCRIRHKDDDLRAGVGAQRGVGMHRTWVDQHKAERKDSTISPRTSTLELPEGDHSNGSSAHKSSASMASTNSSFLAHHFPKRYFILKSLSITDLEESVQSGQWKTQRHNQPILDQAFRTSQEVILIFGANRSGEFFGYAKMSSPSVRNPKVPERQMTTTSPARQASINAARQNSMGLTSPRSHGDAARGPSRRTHPGSTPAPAPIREEEDGTERGEQLRSATDPYRLTPWHPVPSPFRGHSAGDLPEGDHGMGGLHISDPDDEQDLFRSESPELVDDLMRRASTNTLDPNLLRGDRRESRNLLLAAVEHSSSLQIPIVGRKDTAPRRPSEVLNSVPDESESLAPSFRLQWVKTDPLSFSRTRHLRNPWNGDREVKVSRDGTEIEPGVGALLLTEWDKLETNKDTPAS